MNDDLLTDELLHEMFERRAHRGAPDGLRETIMAAAAVEPQRRGLTGVTRLPLRLLAVAALLAATAGAGFIAAGQRNAPTVRFAEAPLATPESATVSFVRPFVYRRSDEAAVGTPVHEGSVVGFSPGSSVYPVTPDRHLVPGSHGIAIAPVSQRVLRRCPGDDDLLPTGDVEAVEGFGVGAARYVPIDGRPALIVDSVPVMRCALAPVDVLQGADVLPFAPRSGIVVMYLPSRMYLTTVDGEPIVFQAWASSAAELDAWLPTAEHFLDGVHFIGVPRSESGSPVASAPPAVPAPQHFAGFVVPFDYLPVDGIPTDHPVFDGTIVGLTPSGSELYPLNNGGVPVEDSRGITLSVVDEAKVHPCPLAADAPSRVPVRADPAGFMDDLEAVAGAGLSNVANGVFDGRPSVMATVDPTLQRCGGRDVHVDGGGLGSAFVRLDVPSQLVVTEVNGRPVVLQIWAATPEGLQRWLPIATRFLDGIHFTGTSAIASPSEASPSADAAVVVVEPPLFTPSFEYRPVDGVPTADRILGAGIIAFTVGGPGAQTLTGGGTPSSDIYPVTEAGLPLPGTHGITIAHLSPGAFVHGCPTGGRTPVRIDPDGFIEDLRAVAGVAAEARPQTTFDGRSAVLVDVDPSQSQCDPADFHTMPSAGLIQKDSYVVVSVPSRLIVTDVNGSTVVLQVWASSPDELAVWLPTATQFLDGIHFTGDSNP